MEMKFADLLYSSFGLDPFEDGTKKLVYEISKSAFQLAGIIRGER
jgi:hypothetical protein